MNEAQTWMWGTADKPAILPKTKGSGIMVSDFIDELNGFLRLLKMPELATSISRASKGVIEYGAARDGYWTGTKFMKQMENAVKIAEFKYTPAMHTLVWLFDQSSCHRAYAPDALNSNNMNVKPEGSQAVMTDTVWAGKVQRLVFNDGVPKGMKQVLEERGINTGTLKADEMRVILANHDDFRAKKTIIEHFLSSHGHQVHFIPKFHCELNPIECVWGQAKWYTRSSAWSEENHGNCSRFCEYYPKILSQGSGVREGIQGRSSSW